MDGSIGKKFLKEYSGFSKPIIAEYLDNEILKAREQGKVPEKLLVAYKNMSMQGKAIRSALINLGYRIFDGDNEEELNKTAIFIELFHTGILAHDDFMDNSDSRRGMPTIHKVFENEGKMLGIKTSQMHYGNSMAVNIGDFAFFLSWEILVQSNFPFERVKLASRVFTEAARNLVHGQVLDITFPAFEDVNEQDVLDMLWTKSGDYSAMLPLTIGAVLAGETLESTRLNLLRKYAECLGWAFQIQDDILGTFGNEEELGKPVGSDFREGKNTLLTLHLRKHGTNEQKDYLKVSLGNHALTLDQAEKLKQMLKDAGSLEYTLNKGWKYVEEGKQYIPSITKNKELQEILESLLIFMMERTK